MTLVEHVKNLVLKGNWWRTLMKGLKLKAKSYTSALSVFENFVSIKRTQPPRIKNLNCLSSLLVSFGCHFCRFLCTKTDFSRSFFCPQSILDSPLLKLDWRQKNYELSQTWTQKYTKKTVKSTSKVHPNYEEWGQKKMEKLKFKLNVKILDCPISNFLEIWYLILIWLYLGFLISYRDVLLLQTELWIPPFKWNMYQPSRIFLAREPV